MKSLKQLLEELNQWRDKCYREIDDNPFIRKKVYWFDRLLGIYESDAERMKKQVDIRYHQNRIQVLKNAKVLGIK